MGLACRHALLSMNNVFVEIGMSHQFQSWEILMNWESWAGTPRQPQACSAAPRHRGRVQGVLEYHMGGSGFVKTDCASIQVFIKHKGIKIKNKKNERDARFKKTRSEKISL